MNNPIRCDLLSYIVGDSVLGVASFLFFCVLIYTWKTWLNWIGILISCVAVVVSLLLQVSMWIPGFVLAALWEGLGFGVEIQKETGMVFDWLERRSEKK